MRRGAGKIGTTRRGIGPAYEDKVGRRAIRVCDLAHVGHLGPQLDRICAHHDALRAGFGKPGSIAAGCGRDLGEIADLVLPFASPVWKTLNDARSRGKRILFEGAQGVVQRLPHRAGKWRTKSAISPRSRSSLARSIRGSPKPARNA